MKLQELLWLIKNADEIGITIKDQTDECLDTNLTSSIIGCRIIENHQFKYLEYEVNHIECTVYDYEEPHLLIYIEEFIKSKEV